MCWCSSLIIVAFSTLSRIWYLGVYLPTSGGIVLLAWEIAHYSLVVPLNAYCTLRLNSGSFKNSIGFLDSLWGDFASLLRPGAPNDFFFNFSCNLSALPSSAIRYISWLILLDFSPIIKPISSYSIEKSSNVFLAYPESKERFLPELNTKY